MKKNKFKHLILPVLVSMVLSACGAPTTLTGPAVDGRVINADTEQPIAGAIVLLKWQAQEILPLMSFDRAPVLCYHVETAVTDEQGLYHTKAWRQAQEAYRLPNGNFTVVAYKPNLIQSNEAGSGGKYWVSGSGIDYWNHDESKELKPDVEMTPFVGTVDERIMALLKLDAHCPFAGASQKNVLFVMNALIEEFSSLPVSEQKKNYVRSLQSQITLIKEHLDTLK